MGIGSILPLSLGNGGLSESSNDILTQVKNNFINLVMTRKGERLSNPNFGCRLHDIIFNYNGNDIEQEVTEAVEDAIQRWMPYITLEESSVNEQNTNSDRNYFQIYLKYRLSDQPNLTDEVLIQL